ncbi:uncharacterized protein LOC135056233 [Pseudophryne corroboree]|uniref:uncharacterized protein LOC135056233 n=1 Tax=Pseudophryne corroboree TaxID=495146 RepID=UPI0030816E46
MSCFLCCGCCVEASKEEQEPLSSGSRIQKQVIVLEKGNKLVVKKVNVAIHDEKFSEIAELYNKQVDYYVTMKDCLSQLKNGNTSAGLASCIETLKTKHNNYDIQIQMEGYNFSLEIKAAKDIPDDLKNAQEVMTRLSQATKLLLGTQTRLGGMIFSLSQEKNKMANDIQEVNTGYLDQIRLVGNLEENIQNIDKAKQLSKEYEEEANKVFMEIAEIAGVTI